jgi:CBS domain-containing protein
MMRYGRDYDFPGWGYLGGPEPRQATDRFGRPQAWIGIEYERVDLEPRGASFDAYGEFDRMRPDPYGAYDSELSGGWGGMRRARSADIRAGDIMTRNPQVVTPDTTLAEAARVMRDLDVGIVPVVQDEASSYLAGVVTDRDIAIRAVAEGKNTKSARVRDVMTEGVATCTESDAIYDLFDVMKREQVRRIPITDDEGRLVGIVAQADLAVDYAGLDPDREVEVEEVIERISEPARPRWENWQGGGDYDRDLRDRIRHGLERGFRGVARGARRVLGRGGYDRPEYGGYDRGDFRRDYGRHWR